MNTTSPWWGKSMANFMGCLIIIELRPKTIHHACVKSLHWLILRGNWKQFIMAFHKPWDSKIYESYSCTNINFKVKRLQLRYKIGTCTKTRNIETKPSNDRNERNHRRSETVETRRPKRMRNHRDDRDRRTMDHIHYSFSESFCFGGYRPI